MAVGAGDKPELLKNHYRGMRLVESVGSRDGDDKSVVERNRFAYNAAGQVSKEVRWLAKVDSPLRGGLVQKVASGDTGLAFGTSFCYDEAGRLFEQVLPDGHTLNYRFSAASGQMESIRFDDAVVAEIEQSLVTGLTGYTNGNGIRHQMTLDSRGQVAEIPAIRRASKPGDGWVTSVWRHVRSWFGYGQGDHSELIYSQINQ